MTTYYQILQVSVDATTAEIRDAYRRQVKKVHPDLNHGNDGSVELMKKLVVAWEVLRDPERRERYNRQNGIHHSSGPGGRQIPDFDYAEFLRNRGDAESRARLIFYDLLHDNPEEALQIYGSMQASGDAELVRHLGTEDFMDCAFLLAEEYLEREELLRGFNLYAAIVRFEEQKPYFRHFMAEVYDRLRNLVCNRMVALEEPAVVLESLHQMLDWKIPQRDRALCCRRIAEIYLARGERRRAALYLQRGLALDNRMVGIKKLREELGYFETV